MCPTYADVDQVIEKDIWKGENLSSKARQKRLAGPPMVKDILSFLWTIDEAEFPHLRIRPQIALSLLIMLYIGLRPGEFLESTAHRGSNQGLF